MRAGLTRRTIIASAVLAVVIGAVFAVLLRAIGEERESARLAEHSGRVLASANALERLVVDLETGQRGYLLSGEERFLEPWRAARRAFAPAGRELVRLAEVRAQHSRAERIVDTIAAYIREYSAPLVDAARRGEASARSVAASEGGKRRVDAIRAQFDDFIAAERRLSARRTDRAETDARLAIVAAIAGLAGSVILIALFGGYFTRAIVVPVRRAAGMAAQLAGGDLRTRMPETGTSEIGDLQRSFNTMGRSLEASRDELRLLAEEQAALRRVATLVARGASPAKVFDAAGAEAGRLLRADATKVLRFEPDGAATLAASHSSRAVETPAGSRVTLDPEGVAASVLRTGRSARVDQGDRAVTIGTPIRVEQRLWGVMIAAWAEADRMMIDAAERMEQFTTLVATAIANADSRAALTASRARVVATADETRRRIERDLHDGAQQRLIHTIITLKLAKRELDEAAPAAGLVDEALAQAETATEALRQLVHGILPSALSRGLGPAVEGLVAHLPLRVSLDIAPDRLPETLERTAYFVVAEALTNVVKHARAQSAEVRASREGATFHVEVRDDGIGGARLDGSSGLLGLQDRVAALNGELRVRSDPGAGTVIVARLPVPG